MTYCHEDEDVVAPRVGCGCQSCYRTREASLDPRLVELALYSPRATVVDLPREILRRQLIHYCSGRLDYGLLHLSIIKALMELAGRAQQQALDMAARMPQPFVSKP